jgi:CheY-like chemotaxis protein
MKRTILFVDNQNDVRQKWAKLLQESGYAVRLASTSQQAHSELMSGGVDLAVIDVRLENDDLESDISGLELAADEAFRHIPKIILTGFPMSYEGQRKVWIPVGGEPPAVIAFVGKEEQPKALLNEIDNAFEVWPRLSMLSSRVSDQIKADHRIIRLQARRNYVISLVTSILGFGLIVAGVILAWKEAFEVGIVGAVAGLIMEAVGYLFYTRLDLANRRMDVYHQELLQTYGLEFLLSVAERLPAERESVCIEHMINAVVANWYPAGTAPDMSSACNTLSPPTAGAGPSKRPSQSSGVEE